MNNGKPKRTMSLLKKLEPRKSMSRDRKNELARKLGPGNYSILARKSGYDATHVTDVLSGRGKCSFEFACVISDITTTSLDDLRDYMDACRKSPPKYKRGGRVELDVA